VNDVLAAAGPANHADLALDDDEETVWLRPGLPENGIGPERAQSGAGQENASGRVIQTAKQVHAVDLGGIDHRV
jgi:hypothetical protein